VKPRRLVPFEIDAVVERARDLAGTDARELQPEIREGLATLLEDLRCIDLNAFGTYLAGDELVRATANALKLEEPNEQRAVLATRPPIVIGGLPRTGTTMLQHLLCCDPDNTSLTCAEAYSPLAQPDQARDLAAIRLDTLRRLAPSFSTIHPYELDGPEECNALTQHTLASIQFLVLFPTLGYSSWLLDGALENGYRWLPQLYQATLGNRQNRRWVLKSPTHLLAYPAIRHIFPEAHLVQISRDPAVAISSWCSLVETTRAIGARTTSDTASRVNEWFDFWSKAVDRSLRSMPRDSCTIRYDDLVRQPMRTIQLVYDSFELELRPDAHNRMTAWLASNAHGRARHAYDPCLVVQTVPARRLNRLRADYRDLVATN